MSHERHRWIWALCFLCLILASADAWSQPAATLVVEEATAEPGETVSVAVRAQDVQDPVFSIQGRIAYDPSVVNVGDVSFHEAFQVTAFNALNAEGVLRFVGTLTLGADEVSGLEDATLFTFEAQAVGENGTSSPLDATFELAKNRAHEHMEVAVEDGTFTIGGQNQPPVADFSFSPERPGPNEDVTFTDASADPDGQVVSWQWDFGDGERLEVQSDSASADVVHAYREPGSYTVTLTVTDNRDATGTVSKTIRVGAEHGEPEIFVFPNPCRTVCNFRYRVPQETERAFVRIYNLRGALVRTVDLNVNVNEVRWNLTDDAGAPAPNGPYFYFMVVQTDAGVRRTPVDVLAIQR